MQNTRWKRDLYEEPAQQRSIRDLYFELIDREIPFVGPVVVIDSSRTPDEVSAQIKRILKTFLTTGQIEEARGELTLL